MDAITPLNEGRCNAAGVGYAHRWTDCLSGRKAPKPETGEVLVGVLPGEGIGPEVIGGTIQVLEAVAAASGMRVKVRHGGLIGRQAERICGAALSEEVVAFCAEVFRDGGAILSGPGGGRYVYDLRKRFDLFFKISPLQTSNGLPDASPLKPEYLWEVDILITRENTGGAYQGTWSEGPTGDGDYRAEQHISYSTTQVQRFLDASARLARQRRGELTVVWKEAGFPSMSRLWGECARQAAGATGVRVTMVDIDLISYQLIRNPHAFDVIAAPNLFGDVIGDIGAVLLGARGLSFSGNYSDGGGAVYQTNHGAAYDLAGKDCANPAAQICSLAMMLRESFGLGRQDEAIVHALRSVWREGYRTSDVAVRGSRVVGTRQLASRVAERAGDLLRGERQAA